MRTKTVVAALVAGALAVGVAAGCRRDKADAADAGAAGADQRERADRDALAEGRLTVDQSAVLPVDVRAGVLREYPGATVQGVQKKTYEDRVVRYEVQLTTKDGKQVTRVFGEDGKPAKE
jgi:hypothetical protein